MGLDEVLVGAMSDIGDESAVGVRVIGVEKGDWGYLAIYWLLQG